MLKRIKQSQYLTLPIVSHQISFPIVILHITFEERNCFLRPSAVGVHQFTGCHNVSFTHTQKKNKEKNKTKTFHPSHIPPTVPTLLPPLVPGYIITCIVAPKKILFFFFPFSFKEWCVWWWLVRANEEKISRFRRKKERKKKEEKPIIQYHNTHNTTRPECGCATDDAVSLSLSLSFWYSLYHSSKYKSKFFFYAHRLNVLRPFFFYFWWRETKKWGWLREGFFFSILRSCSPFGPR